MFYLCFHAVRRRTRSEEKRLQPLRIYLRDYFSEADARMVYYGFDPQIPIEVVCYYWIHVEKGSQTSTYVLFKVLTVTD